MSTPEPIGRQAMAIVGRVATIALRVREGACLALIRVNGVVMRTRISLLILRSRWL